MAKLNNNQINMVLAIDDEDLDEDVQIVTCGCCAKEFKGFAPTQANDCASDITEKGVIGHYGSSVADMKLLEFTKGIVPDDMPIGAQICDACITSKLNSAEIFDREWFDNHAAGVSEDYVWSNWDYTLDNGADTDFFDDFHPEHVSGDPCPRDVMLADMNDQVNYDEGRTLSEVLGETLERKMMEAIMPSESAAKP